MPLWLAECGEGPPPSLRVYRLGSERKGKPLQIYVCNATEIAQWTDERRMLLFVFRDPVTAGEGVMPDDVPNLRMQSVPVHDQVHVNEGVGTNQPIPHALPHVLDTRVLTFLDASPTDYQERWDAPLEPWGRLPRELLASPRDGKLVWSAITRRRDPPVEAMVFCEQGEGDARAFSVALAVCDVLGLKREETLVRTALQDITVKKGEPPPNVHAYESIKAGRSLVL
jgi:hypothetical protein